MFVASIVLGCAHAPVPVAEPVTTLPPEPAPTSAPPPEPPPVVPRLAGTQLASAGEAMCALTEAELLCWGTFALGDSGEARAYLRPQRIASAERVARVLGMPGRLCAIRTDGAAGCWSLGGPSSPFARFVEGAADFDGLFPAQQAVLDLVDFRDGDTCALLAGGRVECRVRVVQAGGDSVARMHVIEGFHDAVALYASGDLLAVRTSGDALEVAKADAESLAADDDAVVTVRSSQLFTAGTARAASSCRGGFCAVDAAGTVTFRTYAVSYGPAPGASRTVVSSRPEPALGGATSLASDGTWLCGTNGAHARCVVHPTAPELLAPLQPARGRRGRAPIVHTMAGETIREAWMVPDLAATFDDASRVAVSGEVVCVTQADGGVACRGLNRTGALGDPTSSDSLVLRPVLDAAGRAFADADRRDELLDPMPDPGASNEVTRTFEWDVPVVLDDAPAPGSRPAAEALSWSAPAIRARFERLRPEVLACVAGEAAITFTVDVVLLGRTNRAGGAFAAGPGLTERAAVCLHDVMVRAAWPRFSDGPVSARMPFLRAFEEEDPEGVGCGGDPAAAAEADLPE